MLSVEESTTLFGFLDADSRPFDEIFADYAAKFSREAQFRSCSSLAILLEDKMLFKPSQRLVAYVILHQAYSSQPPSLNPFITLLVNAASDDASERIEMAFIQILLGSGSGSNSKEVLKQSANDYIKGFDPASCVILPREQLQSQHSNGLKDEPISSIFKAAAVKNVIPDPDIPRGCDLSESKVLPAGAKPIIGYENTNSAITGLLHNISLEGLEPQWIRPSPPMLPIFEGEMMWLNPDNNHDLLWDSGMCADTSRGAAVRDLITKALKGPLVPAQQEVLLDNSYILSLIYNPSMSFIILKD